MVTYQQWVSGLLLLSWGYGPTRHESSPEGMVYNVLHAKTPVGVLFEYFSFALIVTSTLTFMIETVDAVVAITWIYAALE
eukprot:4993092-Amphidinium_carterae.1